MKRLQIAALALLVLFLFGIGNQAAAQRQEPVAYTDYDFRGVKLNLTSDWKGGILFDRKIKSIRVPRGFRVIMYQEKDFRGVETAITEDWNPGPDGEWTRRIRSIRVEWMGSVNRPQPQGVYVPPPPSGTRPPGGIYVPPPPPSGNWGWNRAPVIFADGNHQGTSLRLDRDMSSLGAWDGNPYTIRSIVVPRGWTVTLYTKTRFRGRNHSVYSNTEFRPGDSWYNKIRSIRVQKDNRVPQPR